MALGQSIAVWKNTVCDVVLRRKKLPPSQDGRRLKLSPRDETLTDPRRGAPYVQNDIRSSRYTVYDFFPKQLLFQATRLSNFYFILIGIPQAIPGFSTTGNYTTILPLIFFMLLTMAKEGYDDFRRHRMDHQENTSTTKALKETRGNSRDQSDPILEPSALSSQEKSNASQSTQERCSVVARDEKSDTDGNYQWTETQWRYIKVGAIIKIARNEAFPADVALLSVDGKDDIAYVETMALDGETNLKSRQGLPPFRKFRSLDWIESCNTEFVVEDPNANLYSFEGRATVDGKVYPLTLNEVVYRGSILRNTGSVVGMVLNTGEECKIRMNANQHPEAKKPRLERYMNQIVLSLVFFVIAVSAGCSVGYLIWQRSTERRSFYLDNAAVPFKQIIIGFGITFNNIIPLSLYVSLEIVRLGQAWFMGSDAEMYHQDSDTPMRCNTNTILENLGQIEYILTDKTGTLTQNIMQLRKLSIAGTAWLHEMDMQSKKAISTEGGPTQPRIPAICTQEENDNLPRKGHASFGPTRQSFSQWRSTGQPDHIQPELTTVELLEEIRQSSTSSFSRKAREFLLGMSLCHTCIPEETENGEIVYQAPSPDELSLVRAARELGYTVTQRTSSSVTLRVKSAGGTEQTETYEILDVIEFSSKRRRMSVIVRCPGGKIWLLTKGADSVIVPLLKEGGSIVGDVSEPQDYFDVETGQNDDANNPSTPGDNRLSLSVRKSCNIERRSTSRIRLNPPARGARSSEVFRSNLIRTNTYSAGPNSPLFGQQSKIASEKSASMGLFRSSSQSITRKLSAKSLLDQLKSPLRGAKSSEVLRPNPLIRTGTRSDGSSSPMLEMRPIIQRHLTSGAKVYTSLEVPSPGMSRSVSRKTSANSLLHLVPERATLRTNERYSNSSNRPYAPSNRAQSIEVIRASLADIEVRQSSQRPSFALGSPNFEGKQAMTSTLRGAANLPASTIFNHTLAQVDAFATEGLRTLLFGHRILTEEEYAAWKAIYHPATTSLTNRQNLIEAAGALIETSLDLLGASAIEDKLQPGVPQTIDQLRRAHIKIWMLTGDKRETAINIAHSARICLPESEISVLDSTRGDLAGQIGVVLEEIEAQFAHSVAVIDGHTLAEIDADEGLQALFYLLIPKIDSVICCRASPAQKSGIVKAIRAHIPNALTLAIGDGANDIAMIQASHVGIGISGQEGLQASRVADFSISQFRFLQPLLLLHGHYNYQRTAHFVLHTFWKEMFFYMPQIVYQRYNGFSGTSLYESWTLTVLNVLFTSLCVIVPGITEQHLRKNTLLAVPELYSYGQHNQGLNLPRYLKWAVGAACEGVIVLFTCWAVYSVGTGDLMGDQGLFAVGDLVFGVAIIWTNLKLLILETRNKTILPLLSFGITIAGWWVWQVFLAVAYAKTPAPYAVKGSFFETFGKDLMWWLTTLIVLSILAVMELAFKTIGGCLPRIDLWKPNPGRNSTEEDERRRGVNISMWQEIEKDSVQGAKIDSAARIAKGQDEIP